MARYQVLLTIIIQSPKFPDSSYASETKQHRYPVFYIHFFEFFEINKQSTKNAGSYHRSHASFNIKLDIPVVGCCMLLLLYILRLVGYP